MTHTPGPWSIDERESGEHVIYGLRGGAWVQQVATIVHDEPMRKGDSNANARLIAQAPAMLEALEAIADCFEPNDAFGTIHVGEETLTTIRAIIAEVKGSCGQAV